jgi:hypothetical protein
MPANQPIHAESGQLLLLQQQFIHQLLDSPAANKLAVLRRASSNIQKRISAAIGG